MVIYPILEKTFITANNPRQNGPRQPNLARAYTRCDFSHLLAVPGVLGAGVAVQLVVAFTPARRGQTQLEVGRIRLEGSFWYFGINEERF